MKTAANTIVIAAAALSFAGSAFAAGKVSDVDYLKAARCKGLAQGLNNAAVDTAGLQAFLKVHGQSRTPYIVEAGEAETRKAVRETRVSDRQARLTAELTGGCMAYADGAGPLAAR